MKISYDWLQTYFDKPLPKPEELYTLLSLQAFEVEGIDKVGDDAVIDVDVLPNRAHDALSHNGMARELGVLLDRPVNFPIAEVKTDKTLKSSASLSLEVQDSDLVKRASKRLVADVKVGDSPEWMRKRLEAIGQKSINNIVDATNYVTFETNQPVHAFDFDKLSGKDKKAITIRSAKKSEKIKTLDGEEFGLDEGMLVIADSEKALDIAGIKGGANSGIDENTNKIVLSVCNFDPVNIRKTSKKLGLQTDASKRFENGLSPELVSLAMDRLSALIQEHAGGTVAHDVLDVYPEPENPYKLGLRVSRVNQVLGTDLSEDEVEKILERFGFPYEKINNPMDHVAKSATGFTGVPYTSVGRVRFNAPKEFSCSSFTNYLYLQAGVQLPSLAVGQYMFGEIVEEENARPGDLVFSVGKEPRVCEGAPNGGIGHVGVYLGEGKVIHASGTWDKGEVVIEEYKSSVSFKETKGFRRMPSADEPRLVVTISHERLDLRIEEDLIEEIARVYGYNRVKPRILEKTWEPVINKSYFYASKIRDYLVGKGFSDTYSYSLTDKGEVELKNPFTTEKGRMRESLELGIRDMLEKGEKHLDLLGLDRIRIFEIGNVFKKDDEHTSLGIGVSGKKADSEIADVMEGLSGVLGFNVKESGKSGFVEINLSELVRKLPEPSSYDGLKRVESDRKFAQFSQYPFVLRDIAVWVDSSVSSDDLLDEIEKVAGDLLVKTTLFDEFAKDERTSYAFRLVFQSDDKTLSDSEINTIMTSVEKSISDKGWEVR